MIKEAKIKENNIIVGDKEYDGMPGLWERIAATTHETNQQLTTLLFFSK